MKVSFHTLGCKLNYSETSTLAREFAAGGYERAGRGEAADICIVNSCSVTAEADKKCRNLVRRLQRENPGAIVAVTGCYAQLKPQEIASIEGVDLVVGNDAKGELFTRVAQIAAGEATGPDVSAAAGKGGGHAPENSAATPKNAVICGCEASGLASFFAAFSTGDRTRSFLKVQDGCDYRCSYCTVPLARGQSRNITIAEAVENARRIAATGCREIVITGINTGDFGRTTGEKFIDLLKTLDQVEDIERYRISSIEPNLLTDEIIEFTAGSKKFMPHFHIPLQNGSDRILGLMRRRYTSTAFAARIEAVRKAIPDAFIGIDVIVGFPGETEEDGAQTYSLLERLHPSFLHVFPYSVRANTPAAGFPDKVTPQAAKERTAKLIELSTKLHRRFAERLVGTHAEVLFESTVRGGRMAGFTANYLRVEAPYVREKVGRTSRVFVEGFGSSGELEARIGE